MRTVGRSEFVALRVRAQLAGACIAAAVFFLLLAVGDYEQWEWAKLRFVATVFLYYMAFFALITVKAEDDLLAVVVQLGLALLVLVLMNSLLIVIEVVGGIMTGNAFFVPTEPGRTLFFAETFDTSLWAAVVVYALWARYHGPLFVEETDRSAYRRFINGEYGRRWWRVKEFPDPEPEPCQGDVDGCEQGAPGAPDARSFWAGWWMGGGS